MNVIILVGLPASGKSYKIRELSRKGDLILDDFITPESLKRAIEKNPERLILADPYFCDEFILKVVRSMFSDQDQVVVLYFENNKEAALRNASKRANKKVNDLITYLSYIYKPKRVDFKIYED